MIKVTVEVVWIHTLTQVALNKFTVTVWPEKLVRNLVWRFGVMETNLQTKVHRSLISHGHLITHDVI